MIQVIKAKPTVFDGVEYKSRLEASFAEWMKERGCAFDYFNSNVCIGSEYYAPDFCVYGVNEDEDYYREIWIEMKPIQFHSEAWLAIRAAEETKDNLMVIDSPSRGEFRSFAIVWEGRLDFFTSNDSFMLYVDFSDKYCHPVGAVPRKPRVPRIPRNHFNRGGYLK